jgi:hypothetical protein
MSIEQKLSTIKKKNLYPLREHTKSCNLIIKYYYILCLSTGLPI